MSDLIDTDGENRAVRAFLLLYGGSAGVTTTQMRRHMEQSGYPLWPEWAAYADRHLSKGGAQDWLRHLFALEARAQPQQAEVVPSDVVRDADVEAAAKKMAEIFDYPWDFMPEKGRNTMRENVRTVLDAALESKHD